MPSDHLLPLIRFHIRQDSGCVVPSAAVSPILAAPTDLRGMLRHLGPGLIIAAVIVGSGELIVTPKLGAEVGFTLLWFIVLGCLLKVFIQIELGRVAIARGMTTLEILNTVPGPRLVVSWLVWLWLFMFIALVFQVAGMVGGIVRVFTLAGSNWGNLTWGLLTASSCSTLLLVGRYRLVERLSAGMVAVFTLCTIIAVVALQWTEFAITPANIGQGFLFRLPSDFNTAFAAFGIIGVGASELIYYPYWCLEKGYARHVGPNDGTDDWFARARAWVRVMRLDAWVSASIYTGATLAFYLLGAAVLSTKNLQVNDKNMIETLSWMYKETFGTWGQVIFLIGAFVVLYSTVFGATASNARLFADALSLFRLRHYHDTRQRERVIKIGCVLFPFASLTVYLIWGAPVYLVFVGAIAQALMLPFLGLAALYFRFARTDQRMAPGKIWTLFLVAASVAMLLVGGYQIREQLRTFFS